MIQILRGFAVFFALSLVAIPSFAGSIYSPPRGDPLRKELLDTIRPRVEADLGRQVLFVVSFINVEGNWAFLAVTPVNRDGSKIDVSTTHYAKDADFMDGLTNYAALKYANGRWNEIDWVVGPTDVAYEPWPQKYGFSRALIEAP